MPTDSRARNVVLMTCRRGGSVSPPILANRISPARLPSWLTGCATTLIAAAPYGIAMAKTSGTLKDAVLGAMKALIADGTYKAILDRWKVSDGAITDPVINGAQS